MKLSKAYIYVLAASLACTVTLRAQEAPTPIIEFRTMSAKDTSTVTLKGVVTTVRNAKYGNLYIKDDTAEVLIYGIYIPGGKRFYEAGILPGDTLTVRGRRSLYQELTVEMKGATLLEHRKGPANAGSRLMFSEVDVPPRFQGQDPKKSFSVWVNGKLRYPAKEKAKRKDGYVLAQFVVGEDGSISDVTILDSTSKAFGDEVTRVILKSPQWTPGQMEGRAVPVFYTFPVYFHLTEQH